jgi:predicted nucleic acid-binding protein
MSSLGRIVVDNSAWARLLRGGVPARRARAWSDAVTDGDVLVCEPFRLEALYSARSLEDYEQLVAELDAFERVRCDDMTWALARRAQQDLARDASVSHRVKPIDLLVAASAHQAAADVLHYDGDYDVIAGHTGLSFESVWIAPRGSID